MDDISGNVLYMMTDEQIEKIAERLYQKMLGLQNEPVYIRETCTKDEASKILGVTRMTIYNMARDGRLKTTSDGRRILISSIEDYTSGKTKQDEVKTNRRGHKVYV